MTGLNTCNSFTGRANAVFIFNLGTDSKAVITPIIVQASSEGSDHVRFSGTGSFSQKTVNHLLEFVFPVVDNILRILKLPKINYEVSIVNIDVASMNDIGQTISGFSAGAPTFIAAMSANLEISVPENAVFTGHIASLDGDIRMVKGIPAKLEAITNNESLMTFYHPKIGGDGSLECLSPHEKEKIDEALYEVKRTIRTVGVSDVSELVQHVFSDEQVVIASLKHGFYEIENPTSDQNSAVERAVEYFSKNNAKRFWWVLKGQLIEGRHADAYKLLQAFTMFYIKKKEYPSGFGKRLYRLVQSLPPETRRLKLVFPLIPVSECIQVSQFADESQSEDVFLLFKAVSGERGRRLHQIGLGNQQNSISDKNHSDPLLETVISQINADTLTTVIGLTIDSARGTFLMETVVIDSYEEFSETIASFYLHLLSHTRKIFDTVDMIAAEAEGFDLLERSFSKQGGFRAALAEARTANNGGLRLVLDVMTEQFKKEQQSMHVNHVLKSTLDPLDWQGKVNLIKALMDRLRPHLPNEIISQPAERYAGHYENIVEAYVQSMDKVKTLFRSF